MKKQPGPRRLPFKLLIASIIIFVVFYFIAGYFKKALKSADYFKIKDVIVTPGSATGFSYLKGRDIFSVDLEKESKRILEAHPACRRVRLVRILPDRLFVDFSERQPVALVKLYRYFYVDKDAVFFEVPNQAQAPDLPFISGLEKKSFTPQPGKKYNSRELSLALSIIKEAGLSRALKDYKLKRVDVADYNNASFFISTTAPRILEIKVGESNISGKMNILGKLLEQLENDLGKIKYIDLRFKEPVIKFNEDKNVR